MNLLQPKKDLTQILLNFLVRHKIQFAGKKSIVTIECPFGKSKHSAFLMMQFGVLHCHTCNRIWDFHMFQKKIIGNIETNLSQILQADIHPGLFGKFQSDVTQTQMEQICIESHQNLIGCAELKGLLKERLGLLNSTLVGYRLGVLYEDYGIQILGKFIGWITIPIVSIEGYYKGLRFISMQTISKGIRENRLLGFGLNTTFWGCPPTVSKHILILPAILDVMNVSQNLFESSRLDVCSITQSNSCQRIPMEWKYPNLFHKKKVWVMGSMPFCLSIKNQISEVNIQIISSNSEII